MFYSKAEQVCFPVFTTLDYFVTILGVKTFLSSWRVGSCPGSPGQLGRPLSMIGSAGREQCVPEGPRNDTVLEAVQGSQRHMDMLNVAAAALPGLWNM